MGYEYFSKQYKLIAIDLSKQIEQENPDLKQQISFFGRLEDDEVTFFINEESGETTFEFSQRFVNIIQNGTTKDYKLVKWFKLWRI